MRVSAAIQLGWFVLFTLNAQTLDIRGSRAVSQAIRLFEEWMEAEMDYKKIPGAAVGLVHDQELIWSRGFGFADLEGGRPQSDVTIHSICSISKLFTSVAIMQLRDAGKLRLDDPVSSHLSYFNLDPAGGEEPEPTIRSLLTHSGGLPRESDHPYWTAPDFEFPTREEIIEGLRNQAMLYSPDHYFQYSNLGMSLLGQIVEKASGQDYQTYVNEHILGPLSLSHTTPFLPESERGKLMAQGYGILTRTGERDSMPFFQADGMVPAAGFASNVQDLAQFASWQLRTLAGEDSEVLRSHTLREMQNVHWVDPDWKTTWGLGFKVYRLDDETWVGHGGSCPGFRTVLLLVPKRKLAAVVMFNAMGLNPDAFAGQLIKTVGSGVEKALSNSENTIPESTADMSPYEGAYSSAWGEIVVVAWEDGLAAFYAPTDEPLDELVRLRPVSSDIFQRVRKDTEELGETWAFERDSEGQVVRFKVHGNYFEKNP